MPGAARRLADHPCCPPSCCSVVGKPVYLRKLKINSGGYDEGGAYWGLGQPVYWASLDDPEFSVTVRAHSRADAKNQISRMYPGIRFKR